MENETPVRSHQKFSFQNQFEKRLLRQIAGQVLNTSRPQSWYYKKKSKIIIFELSELEYLEMKLRWNVYRTAWKKEQERFFGAFVQSQHIFPENPDIKNETKNLSPEDLAEAEAMLRMAAGIQPVTIHRPLPSRID